MRRTERSSRGDRCGLLLIICAAMSLVACAHVESFRAEPRNACEGDYVTVHWDAGWRVELDSMPAMEGMGRQPSKGSKAFAVGEPTRFVLTAYGIVGSPKTAEADIDVAPAKHTFGEVAQCDAEHRVLHATFPLETQISRGFRVGTLVNVLPRTLSVDKDGHEVKLGDGEQSDGLRGELATGTWRLTSPLAALETCDIALRSIRQRLRVQIRLACGN